MSVFIASDKPEHLHARNVLIELFTVKLAQYRYYLTNEANLSSDEIVEHVSRIMGGLAGLSYVGESMQLDLVGDATSKAKTLAGMSVIAYTDGFKAMAEKELKKGDKKSAETAAK
jgi:hypothetical protein